MPAQHTMYIEPEQIITNYLTESEQNIQKYFKLWHILCRGMKELGLDFYYTVKSVKLPVQSNLTVPLPNDYLQYSKVGVLNAAGEIIPMGYNSNLTSFAGLQSTRIEQTQDNNIAGIDQSTPIWYNYGLYGDFTNYYGLPSGSPFIGNFKIDNANGIILLSENFGYDYIMLEYLSTPQEGSTFPIPMQFEEALISYLRWKDIISTTVKTHMQNANVEMRRREYFNERRLAIARFKPINLNDLYQANLINQRLTVKI